MKTKNVLVAAMVLLIGSGLTACGDDDDAGGNPIDTPTATRTTDPSIATPTATAPAAGTPTVEDETPTPSATPTPETEATNTPGQVAAGRIVFAANPDGSFFSDIFLINSDGSGRTNLTDTPDIAETQPSWSPDGNRVLFRAGDDTLAVVNPDGTGRTGLLTSDGPIYYPAWSVDGSRIVFVEDEDFSTQGDNTIAVVNADGSGLTTVLAVKGDYLSPSFSPDGSQIAYAANIGGGAIELFVMNDDGSGNEQVTDGVGVDGPAWSPAADEIAFASSNGIDAIAPDGSGERSIVVSANGPRNPAWNATGSALAFDVFSVGIGIVNADGTGEQPVPNTSDGFDPDLD